MFLEWNRGDLSCPPALRLRKASSAMAGVDRLGWTAGLSFTSYGARFGVRVNDARILPRLPKYLPPGHRLSPWPVVDHLYSWWVDQRTQRPGAGGGSLHRLYAGAECIQEAADPDEILKTLEGCLHFDTALGARQKLFVHAGVVGWQGQAILIPGRSFSGKTSLVAAMVRAGATYCSDEYAVLDDRGWVHPYPKPLSIRDTDGNTAQRCPVEALGGQPAVQPLPVGLVAVVPYQAGASWCPRALSPGAVVMALLDNTVLVRQKPEQTLCILSRVADRARGLESVRGEVEQAVPLLLEWFTRQTGVAAGKISKEQGPDPL